MKTKAAESDVQFSNLHQALIDTCRKGDAVDQGRASPGADKCSLMNLVEEK
jgi:hypothetical protein